MRFTDAWQIEEYGRSSSGSLEVEYLFLAADPDGSVVLDANFDVSRAVRLFRRNREGTSDWGVLGRVGKLGGTLFYRPYRLGDRACFGFKGDLRLRADDPRRRPGEVLLGYGCSVAGGTLSPATIEAFLDGVGPRRPIAPVHLPSSPWGAGALEFARGSAEASGGLVSFPLRLAELYTTTDSGDAW